MKLYQLLISAALCLPTLAAFAGPSSTSGDETPEAVAEIAFGTYYGECSGYCLTVYELRKSPGLGDYFLTGLKHGWDRNDPHAPLLSAAAFVAEADFAAAQELADFTVFKTYADRYGCPDCADGGAFWIRVTTDRGHTKKIEIDRLQDVEAALDPVTYAKYFKPLYDKLVALRSTLVFGGKAP